MKTSTIVWIIIVIIIVVGGIWWFAQSGNSTPPATTTTTTTTPGETLTVGTNDTLGSYLEAAGGMTLYTNASDTAGTSTCSGDCAVTWPPYTVSSASGLTLDPTATGTIGTITRSDGTLQVTYNGMPLYFYSQDVNPGDTNGNGVATAWTVAKP